MKQLETINVGNESEDSFDDWVIFFNEIVKMFKIIIIDDFRFEDQH